MDVTLNCKISLSKKLRKVLGTEGGTLTLATSDLINGKGYCRLSLSSDLPKEFVGIPEELIDETSIQITAVEIMDEVPNNSTVAQGTIFTTVPEKGEYSPVVSKMAVVHAPEKSEISRAVVKEVKTPEAFRQLDEPECREWVGNMEELVVAVSDAKSKKSDINLSNTSNEKERAIMSVMKEKEEAIDVPAWIVNTEVAKLSINDIDVDLDMNFPYDLSNVSAKRIAYSRDLRAVIKAGYVKFISPSEVEAYLGKMQGAETVGLEVFGTAEEAAANMSSGPNTSGPSDLIDEGGSMELTESDMQLTDEESMVLNLTQDMPTSRARNILDTSAPSDISDAPVSRKTAHNRGEAHVSQNPNIRTIRKA